MGLQAAGALHGRGAGGECVASAAPQAPLELRFDIADYKVEGNTLLKPADIARALAPFRGKNRDFGDVQRAVEALEAAYRKAGYAAVRVYLPEQELNEGVVILRVVEAKIGAVTVSGNKYFDAANIRRSVPAVREGTTPSAPRIADNTRLANENTAKQTRVVLRPAGQPNEVDAVIEVEDEKPWRAFLTLDNTGTPDTGDYRLGVGYQHNNMFNRDQTLTAQYITSPTEPDQVSIYSVGYRHPHLLARRQHRPHRRLFRRGRRHHADAGRTARVHRTGVRVPGALQLAAAAPRRVRASRHLRPRLSPVRQLL